MIARDASWDGGEEKERRVRSAEKGQMDTSKGIGCWKTVVWDGKEFPGIRVLGFRRISSSTLEIFFENKHFITCDLFGEFFRTLHY